MIKTRGGVYHNLSKSEYAISNGEVALFFSSLFYLNKFMKEYEDHREHYFKRIQRAMIIDMNTNRMADIYLYKEIEKRGFRVVSLQNTDKFVKGDLTWHESHLYGLWLGIEKSTPGWLRIPEQKCRELGLNTE